MQLIGALNARFKLRHIKIQLSNYKSGQNKYLPGPGLGVPSIDQCAGLEKYMFEKYYNVSAPSRHLMLGHHISIFICFLSIQPYLNW